MIWCIPRLKKRIENLERNLAIHMNPYKFDIEQRVRYRDQFDKLIPCKVVNQKYTLSHGHAGYFRYNVYTVFDGKRTKDIDEGELIELNTPIKKKRT